MIAVAARLRRTLAVLLGAALVSAPVAAEPPRTPEKVPPAWIAYAQTATRAVTARLQGEDEAAVRLRAYLDTTRPAPDQATLPLILKLWIASDGTVSRIEFPPFAEPQANADLRSLVIGRTLAGTPPRDMRQPLRLAVQLAPAPAPDNGAPPPGNSV